MNESHRWSLFLQGDKHAFSEIFLAFHDDLLPLWHEAYPRSGDCQRLHSEPIPQALEKPEQPETRTDLKPYLFRSLRHHIIDILELQKQTLPINQELRSCV